MVKKKDKRKTWKEQERKTSNEFVPMVQLKEVNYLGNSFKDKLNISLKLFMSNLFGYFRTNYFKIVYYLFIRLFVYFRSRQQDPVSNEVNSTSTSRYSIIWFNIISFVQFSSIDPSSTTVWFTTQIIKLVANLWICQFAIANNKQQ